MSYGPEDVYYLAGEGDVEELQLALTYGNNSFEFWKDDNNSTALHYASQEGHIQCIDLLLNTEADIENRNNNGCTILHMAAFHGQNEMIGVLVDRGANIESRQNQGYTALNFAAQEGHIHCISVLLDRGSDIESRESEGRQTSLHSACRNGHTDCVELLLNRGADINTQAFHGETALHIASEKGHTDCIDLLLNRGAVDFIDSLDRHSDSALHIAAREGHIQCIDSLLNRGADIGNLAFHGETALHIAAKEGYTDCIDLLLSRGAVIDSLDNHGETALIVSAHNKQIECTRLLLNRGAAIDEGVIGSITHRRCRQMIIDEIQHRLRRSSFDRFIKHYIKHPPLIRSIYSTCYPSGDLRVAAPNIGWDRAEAVRNKYYFEEVFFYLHVFVAIELAKKANVQKKRTSRRCSKFQGCLAKNSNDTSTLMVVLSDRLKMYLKPI